MLIPCLEPIEPADGPATVVTVLPNGVSIAEREVARDEGAIFIGTLADQNWWAVDGSVGDGAGGGAAANAEPPDDVVDLMRLYGMVDEARWLAAGRAVQLVAWARDNRFCGRCATPTEPVEGERALRCPACGLNAFPRLAPAAIVLVERDDGRALLARNARWPAPMYSCLAGFVEPGETLESAARREIEEEVGIRVGALRYFDSQPWPFPHSLMLGLHADYESGEIACDGTEISDAQWFSPDDLPQIPGPISIARRLIDDWLARARAAPGTSVG